MKRVPIIEESPWGNGDHPHARKPLSAFRWVTATCNDCGHTKSLDEDELANLSAVPSLGYLAKRAFCSACREAGHTGRANLEFRTELRAAAPAPVEWSSKKVFGDDRTDVHPKLGPSRLMREGR